MTTTRFKEQYTIKLSQTKCLNHQNKYKSDFGDTFIMEFLHQNQKTYT